MNRQPSYDTSLSVRSEGSARYTPHGRLASLDEAALHRYSEVRRREEAHVTAATTVPSSVRDIHEIVKQAAARHRAKQSEAEVSSADKLDETQMAQAKKAAEESALYRAYEEKIFEADVRIQDLRVELVSAEAHEAAQSAEWQDRYFEEVQVARRQWQSMSNLEERETSRLDVRDALERDELERWQKEAAENQKACEVERERLLDEFEDAKTQAEWSRIRAADYEMKVRQTENAVAQSTRENVNYAEESAMSHAHERAANLQTQAADAALALTIRKELQETAMEQSLRAELKAMLAGEANTVTILETEARAESSVASTLRERISQLTAENVHDVEALRQLEASETIKRDHHEASEGLHVDAIGLKEHLTKFIENWNGGSNEEDNASAVEAVRNVQEHMLAQRKRAGSVEEIAQAEAATEAAIAKSSQHICEEIRMELLETSQEQRNLQCELMALSSAAASARALVAAKDASIAECEAATQTLATMECRMGPKSDSPRNAVLKKRSHLGATPEEPEKQPHSTSLEESSEKRLDGKEKVDWQRLASIVGATSTAGDALSSGSTLELDNVSSAGYPRASNSDSLSATSASDNARSQSSGLAFGKAVHPRGPSLSTEYIPNAFAKFRASLKRAEASPVPEPQPMQSQPDRRAHEPNFDNTQQWVTDQIRHDVSQLRRMFSQLSPRDRSALSEGRLDSARTDVDVRTRSPLAPKRSVRRRSTECLRLRSADGIRNGVSETKGGMYASPPLRESRQALSKTCRDALRQVSVSHSGAKSNAEKPIENTEKWREAQDRSSTLRYEPSPAPVGQMLFTRNPNIRTPRDATREPRGSVIASQVQKSQVEVQLSLSSVCIQESGASVGAPQNAVQPLLSSVTTSAQSATSSPQSGVPSLSTPKNCIQESRVSATAPQIEIQRSLSSGSPRRATVQGATRSPQNGVQVPASILTSNVSSKRVESNGTGPNRSIRFSTSTVTKPQQQSARFSLHQPTTSSPSYTSTLNSYVSPLNMATKVDQHLVAPQHFIPSLPVKR